MKSFHLLLLCSALAGIVSPIMAQTGASPIIGFYKFTVPSGTSAWTCGLVTKKDFQGAMSATATAGTKSTITASSATWAVGAFPLHYVEILSGPQTGLILDIDPTVANTATQLTVIGKTTGAASFGLTGTETFCIRRHNTLGTVFQNGAGLQDFSDLVTLINDQGKEIVYGLSGGAWVDGGDFFTPKSDTILYPGQGFLISTGASTLLTFGGGSVAYVRNGPLKIPVYAGKRNLIGIVSPLVATPPDATSTVPGSSLGLVSFLNGFSDIINTFSNDGLLRDSAVFGSDFVNLVDGQTFSVNKNNTPFANGSAFASTPPTDTIYTQPSLVP